MIVATVNLLERYILGAGIPNPVVEILLPHPNSGFRIAPSLEVPSTRILEHHNLTLTISHSHIPTTNLIVTMTASFLWDLGQHALRLCLPSLADMIVVANATSTVLKRMNHNSNRLPVTKKVSILSCNIKHVKILTLSRYSR